MRNRPKYHFFKNTSYAIDGLREVYKTESSFKIEVVLFVLIEIINVFLPMGLLYKIILGLIIFIPIMAELANSAIERVVDLASPKQHILAKQAKDAGSALVFVSLVFTILGIITIFMFAFGIIDKIL